MSERLAYFKRQQKLARVLGYSLTVTGCGRYKMTHRASRRYTTFKTIKTLGPLLSEVVKKHQKELPLEQQQS